MIIKQVITYYVQMEQDDGEWRVIGAMDMEWKYALESLKQKRKTFPDNNFRLVGKIVRHEVDEECLDSWIFEGRSIEKEQMAEYSKVVAEGLKGHIR